MANPRVSRLREVAKNWFLFRLNQWIGADTSDPAVIDRCEKLGANMTLRLADLLQNLLDDMTPAQKAARLDNGLDTIIATLREDATDWNPTDEIPAL